jgi:hypothetical protein
MGKRQQTRKQRGGNPFYNLIGYPIQQGYDESVNLIQAINHLFSNDPHLLGFSNAINRAKTSVSKDILNFLNDNKNYILQPTHGQKLFDSLNKNLAPEEQITFTPTPVTIQNDESMLSSLYQNSIPLALAGALGGLSYGLYKYYISREKTKTPKKTRRRVKKST